MTPSHTIEIWPQVIQREVYGWIDSEGRRGMKTIDDPTGWVEARSSDGLRALAQTERGARSMIERMRAARRPT